MHELISSTTGYRYCLDYFKRLHLLINNHIQTPLIRHRHPSEPTALGINIRKELLIPISRHDRIVNDDRSARTEVRLDELQRGEG